MQFLWHIIRKPPFPPRNAKKAAFPGKGESRP
jgi:hypothetical protein